MKKYLLSITAFLFAIALFSFTSNPSSEDQSRSELVWFMVNTNGVILNPDEGVLDDDPPGSYGCTGSPIIRCAYGYDLSDVNDNGDGTYTIKPASGTFNPLTDFEAERKKQP
jgi:hypothetical protein